MRKYQQLVLVIISLISVTTLLVYRSENSKLKYVLNVVNFFGRKDAANLMKMENAKMLEIETNFIGPLPAWQRLDDNFHAYSSYWHKTDFKSGGEVISIATGLAHSIVQFNCVIQFENGKIFGGKFGYIRVETNVDVKSPNENSNFIVYKFLCKVSRDFGIPTKIIYKNIQTGQQIGLPVHTNSTSSNARPVISACVDLNEYNITQPSEFVNERNLFEFFLSHKLIGVENFIVYNSNLLRQSFINELLTKSVRLHLLPYNFPYSLENNAEKNRKIIELDCNLRNINLAKYYMVLGPNEVLYTNGLIKSSQSLFMQELNDYNANTINKYEIETLNICLKNNTHLFDGNYRIDVDRINQNPFYVYKPEFSPVSDGSVERGGGDKQTAKKGSIKLKNNLAILQRFSVCGNEKTANLKDYRNFIVSDEYFLNFISNIQLETKKLVN